MHWPDLEAGNVGNHRHRGCDYLFTVVFDILLSVGARCAMSVDGPRRLPTSYSRRGLEGRTGDA